MRNHKIGQFFYARVNTGEVNWSHNIPTLNIAVILDDVSVGLFLGLFKGSPERSDLVALNNVVVAELTNGIQCERKRPGPMLKYSESICLEGMKKTMMNLP
jgi:hypothetical protein